MFAQWLGVGGGADTFSEAFETVVGAEDVNGAALQPRAVIARQLQRVEVAVGRADLVDFEVGDAHDLRFWKGVGVAGVDAFAADENFFGIVLEYVVGVVGEGSFGEVSRGIIGGCHSVDLVEKNASVTENPAITQT